ncbi:MAG: MauE/DoxX family redox-associated membrane protein [Myxococcota bacterium]
MSALAALDAVARDPATALVARLALALLFASAALHKARGPRAFAATVRDYRVLPAAAAAPAALAIAALEAAVAAGLTAAAGLAIAGSEPGGASAPFAHGGASVPLAHAGTSVPLAHAGTSILLAHTGALGLLGAYSAAIAANLARGRRDVDCGCLGPGRRQPIAPWMLARNAALALAAAWPWLAPSSAPRALGALDAATVAFALAALALLWTGAHAVAALPAAARARDARSGRVPHTAEVAP